MERHLFLFGSASSMTGKLAERFVALAGEEAAIAIFYEAGTDSGLPGSDIVQLLKDKGAGLVHFFPIQEELGRQERGKLNTCTGAILIGRNAEELQTRIVGTDYGKAIQNLSKIGKPIAAFAEAALIIPEHCVISPKENSTGSQVYREGLGLLSNQVISVHFETWEEEFSLKIAMKKTGASYGYGLENGTGAYFVDSRLVEKDGTGQIHFYKQKEKAE